MRYCVGRLNKPPKNLKQKTARGIAASLIAAVGTNAIRIASLAILGRIIAPGEFGVVAVAMTVVVIVQNVRDIGLGSALKQRQNLQDSEVRSAFAFSIWLGCFLSAAMAISAPWIGSAFREPAAVPLLRALSLMFALRGVSMVSYALAQREFEFGKLAYIDTISYGIGSVATIVLALMGQGAWAIVWGDLIEVALSAVALLWIRPPLVSLRVNWRVLRPLLGMGTGYTINQIAGAFATQGDNAVVSRELGRDLLGYYSRAYDMVRIPSMMFTSIVGSVLFPAFATLQNDPVRLGVAFRRTLFATAAILIPASVGLIVLAPEVVFILIGPQWTDAVLPFQIMGASMLFRTSYKIGAIVALSAGDATRTAVTQTIYALLVVVGATIATRWGIAGVAATTATAVALNFFMLAGMGLRHTNLGWLDLFAAHREPLFAGLLTLIGAWSTAAMLRELHAPVAVTLVATTVVGAIGPSLLAYRGIRRPGSDWHWVWDTLRSGLKKKKKKARAPTT